LGLQGSCPALPFPTSPDIILPGNTFHFHWVKFGGYVTRVTAIGPMGLEYLDPRHK
jgi:hypothetical protein